MRTSAYRLNFELLEQFLKGEMTLQSAERQATAANRALVAQAIAIGMPERYLQSGLVLAVTMSELFREVMPGSNTNSMAICSLRAGLHVNLRGGSGHGPIQLTPPAEALALIEQYKDSLGGGIAQFRSSQPNQINVLPDAQEVVSDLITRLRRVYGPEVLQLLKQQL